MQNAITDKLYFLLFSIKLTWIKRIVVFIEQLRCSQSLCVCVCVHYSKSTNYLILFISLLFIAVVLHFLLLFYFDCIVKHLCTKSATEIKCDLFFMSVV